MEKLKLTTEEQNAVMESFKKQLKDCNRFSAFKPSFNEFLKFDPKTVKKPTLRIPTDIYVKMFQLVHESSTEVQWHGLVHRDLENQIYTIYDILMFPQINSAITTNTNPQEFADWIGEKILDLEFPIQDMRMHGHSHVNMDVFSSAIDDTYQTDLLSKVEDGDYYLYLILNKKHEVCVLLYDLHQSVLFQNKDITIEIVTSEGKDISTWAKKQIEEYCITAKTKTKSQWTNCQNQEPNEKYYTPLIKTVKGGK